MIGRAPGIRIRPIHPRGVGVYPHQRKPTCRGKVKWLTARTDRTPVLTATIVFATLIALWGGLIPLHRRHHDAD